MKYREKKAKNSDWRLNNNLEIEVSSTLNKFDSFSVLTKIQGNPVKQKIAQIHNIICRILLLFLFITNVFYAITR